MTARVTHGFRILSTRLLVPIALSAFVGLQFGLFETLALRTGSFAVDVMALLEIVIGHVLLGTALGLPAAVGMFLLATALPRLFSRWAQLIPPLLVLIVFAVAVVNVRTPHSVLHPMSLVMDAAVLAAAGFATWLWCGRLQGHHLKRTFAVALVMLDAGVCLATLRSPEAGTIADASGSDGHSRKDVPNLVVILIDTLRADHVGSYGYRRDTTPSIDELAAGGALFERAYSTSNWTRPAIASLQTSTMPSRHGMIDVNRGVPALPLLAEVLQGMGYATAFFSAGVNASPEDGYGRGLDHFYSARSRAAIARTPVFDKIVLKRFPRVTSWLPARSDTGQPDQITDKVLTWVRDLRPDRPVFLYVHYHGPHMPYRPPPPYDRVFSKLPVQEHLTEPPGLRAGPSALSPADREQMIAQYDGEVLLHDAEVGRLLDGLRAAGRLDTAIVVVTADHGEAFGEHGVWGHSVSLFEEVVRVPLIVWSNPAIASPRRLVVPASLLDLAPTLVDLVGGSPPEEWDGSSLKSWLLGLRTHSDRIVFQEDGSGAVRGLRNAHWAYFEENYQGHLRRWLYAAGDREQHDNLAAKYPEQLARLAELVAQREAMDRSGGSKNPRIEIDEERLERLKALGYVD